MLIHHTLNSFRGLQTWKGATGRMWLHGSMLATARRQGYAAMWGAMQQQAAILSFLDLFLLMAVIFVILIPFVLIMKKPGKSSNPMASH